MAAKKTTGRKKKDEGRKKSGAKKAAVRRTAGKQAAAKRTTARKTAAGKKAGAKKASARNVAAKKAAPRGSAGRKPAAKTAAPPAQAMRMERYDPKAIEAKWQARWEADHLHRAVIDPSRPKYYALTMLPYPSGDLHIGHWYAMTPSDARARWLRMRGYNVMFPIGFDAFGLPAENAAIQRGIHPAEWTYANIANMRQQLRSMGATWDWEREALSADPEYYRWTQWYFIQLVKHGLAYKKLAAVDWCPKDNTTLAREQVVGDNRVCERCGTPVVKKNLEQWFFRITNYADELLSFEGIDWPEPIRLLQTNWIGRSEGANVTFISEQEDPIEVFTTRPDTLWGATFMVLAPEHPLVAKLTTDDRRAAVEAYVAEATRQTDIQREATDKEKSGVFTGAYAINPVNGERVPIWTADYVLMTYGTGAIMGVPAHDQRDFEFARKYGLEVRVVVQPPDRPGVSGDELSEAWPHDGVMVNSGPINGVPAGKGEGESVKAAIAWLEANGAGQGAVTYRIRDWLISRQRYWGAPIPIVYCPKHGQVPVPDDQLPVTLPMDVEWKPTGESPLKLHPTWSQTTCPICGQAATRDTDTMDTFMCSSWYHLRYLSPKYDKAPGFDPREYDYWMPVDTYTGGAEHATMHLIYTRFFHKALRDMGVVRDAEPMRQLRNQGQILGPDGQRMSKSRGNVIDPDEQVRAHGADAVRAYLLFGYEWSEGGPWSTENIQGVVRWLGRVWVMAQGGGRKPEARGQLTGGADEAGNVQKEAVALRRTVHQTIKKVSDDMEAFEFNTIVSALMELTNELYRRREALEGTPVFEEAITTLLKLMAPITPHIAEELWERRGERYSIHQQAWPEYDAAAAAEEVLTIVVQVNGKVRDRVQVPAGMGEAEVKAAALATEGAQRHLDGQTPRQLVYVPGRLVNIVV